MYNFIVSLILDYCEGDFVFVSLNKQWKREYTLKYPNCITVPRFLTKKQIDWITTTYFTYKRAVSRFAIKNGDLDIIKYLSSKDLFDNVRAAEIASEAGHVHILEWLWKRNKSVHKSLHSVVSAALYNGRINVLEWIHKHVSIKWNRYHCDAAASGGQNEVLKWLEWKNCRFDTYVCASASRARKWDTVKWLYENGCSIGHHTWMDALCQENIELVQWLYNEDMNAARAGKLELHLQEKDHYQKVIKTKSMIALEWLYTHNFPLSEVAIDSALERNDPKVLQWLEERAGQRKRN